MCNWKSIISATNKETMCHGPKYLSKFLIWVQRIQGSYCLLPSPFFWVMIAWNSFERWYNPSLWTKRRLISTLNKSSTFSKLSVPLPSQNSLFLLVSCRLMCIVSMSRNIIPTFWLLLLLCITKFTVSDPRVLNIFVSISEIVNSLVY